MTRDQHAVARAGAVGFLFVEYPSGRFSFHSPNATVPADAAEIQCIREHLRDNWSVMTGIVAAYLDHQRLASEPFKSDV